MPEISCESTVIFDSCFSKMPPVAGSPCVAGGTGGVGGVTPGGLITGGGGTGGGFDF